MKKIKLRKWVYVALVIILAVCISSVYLTGVKNSKNESNESEEKKLDIGDIKKEILSYNEDDFDNSFLDFINENYGNKTLQKLLEKLKDNKYDKTVWHELTGNSYIVLNDLYNDKYKNNSQVTVIDGSKDNVKISFAGDISLADNWEIMPYYKSRNKKIYGVLSTDTVDYMKNSDLMIINNEFSFSNRGTPMANKTYTFRANPSNVSIYDEIGVDMVTLANNHVYDFGTDAFLDTLDTLKEHNMPYIGAGRNIDEASKPYYFVINGYKIAFLNASRAEKFILTPEAGDNSPGVFRAYDPKPMASAIEKAKNESDYVVALLHWGKEDSHELEDVILKDAKLYVDSGASLVVGTHAHVLEGMEYYKDKLIAYNLGDFLFSHVSDYTGILTLNLSYDGKMTYQFIPAYQKDFFTSIISGDEAEKLYSLMNKWSVNVNIDSNGNVKQNS